MIVKCQHPIPGVLSNTALYAHNSSKGAGVTLHAEKPETGVTWPLVHTSYLLHSVFGLFKPFPQDTALFSQCSLVALGVDWP